MKQQFLKDKTDTIRLSIYSTNVQQVPTSGTIVLKNPSGQEIQASTAVTVGSDGELTYSLTTTHTATLDLNYIAEWTYVIDGVTYYETQLFDVVRSILSIPITDEDLYNELESLRESSAQEDGTATGGSSTTLVDTSRKEADEYWNGGTIEIISGTGSGQVRDITSFSKSSSTITVSTAWVTEPDTTSKYIIVRSFSKKILQSFEEIETMLYNKGQRHSLIIESSQIKFPLTYLTIHKICLDLMSETEDKYGVLADQYWNKFEMAFSNMKVDYDADESGTIDGDEESQRSITGVRLWRT